MASGGRRRKPRRGSRPKKARKTKYLSLSRLIVKTEEVETPQDDAGSPSPSREEEEAEVKKDDDEGGGGHHEADPPFALHHEASTLFAAMPAPSLSDILGAASSDGSASPSTSPGGARFPGAEVEEEEEDLARRALRGRERWVYCCTTSSSSNSSSSPTTTATASVSSSPCSSSAASGASARPSLLLKLDYQEILAAWADRGPLYIGHATPKQVPQPELVHNFVQVLVAVEPAQHPPDPATTCLPETMRYARAESVRRYKEKRRNRLFAHRVRYEVRRVNAVKRPRFKGRFVKEQGDMEIQST